MSNNRTPEGQFTLFEPETLYSAQVARSLNGYDVVTTYGKQGSYMNVVERAGHLILALDAISQRNIRDGISLGAYTKAYSAPIWERYQEATLGVLDGASRNRDKYQNQLRENFWHATGFAALRGNRLMREKQVNPRAQKMWRDFNKEYGHPDDLRKRNQYKKLLRAQVSFLAHQETDLAV